MYFEKRETCKRSSMTHTYRQGCTFHVSLLCDFLDTFLEDHLLQNTPLEWHLRVEKQPVIHTQESSPVQLFPTPSVKELQINIQSIEDSANIKPSLETADAQTLLTYYVE